DIDYLARLAPPKLVRPIAFQEPLRMTRFFVRCFDNDLEKARLEVVSRARGFGKEGSVRLFAAASAILPFVIRGFANAANVASRLDVAAVAQKLADARLQRRGEQRFSTATCFVFHCAIRISDLGMVSMVSMVF